MKISGSWASLLRGVSQQPPEVRMAGQHAEQVNLLSDPVAGLTRRRGTVYQNKLDVGVLGAPAELAYLLGTGGYRKLEHSTDGKEYVILVRENTPNAALTGAGAVICYNVTDRVFVPLATDALTTARVAQIATYGVQALVSAGKYVVHTYKGEVFTASSTLRWEAASNNYPVLWVRGGAYNRTYRVELSSGTVFSYTTPGAAVAGSGDAISPQAIAANLAAAGVAAGLPIGQIGSHLYIDGPTEGAGILTMTVTDGGDGGLLLGVARTTDNVSKLPLMAVAGTIIKIETGPNESFYVEAFSKKPGGGGINEVVWRECAGVQQGSIGLGLMAVEAGTLRLGLTSAIPAWPQVIASGSGDTLTNPAPAFLRGYPVTYLGLFQDRLVVGAGAAVAVSAAGDYFNFFRSSVVTVPLKDPFEMIAQGGEDDVLRHSVAYNRNLVIFGDKRQYLISGQTALTPTSANMSIMTTYADAAETAPIAAGGQIYYARNREGNVGLHQIQPGAFVDSAESFPSSAQIGDYIKAPAAQLEIVPGAPSLLLVRSAITGNGLTVFSYLDTPEGRKQDAWNRWEFSATCGSLLAVMSTPAGVLLFWLRKVDGAYFVVCDLMPLATQLGTLPFLDSARSITVATNGTTDVNIDGVGDYTAWRLAFDSRTDRFLIGGTMADRTSLAAEYPTEYAQAWVGLPFDSYVELTNPFIRDKSEIPVLEGRLVITKLQVNLRNSSGLDATVTSGNASSTYSFNGRVLGDVLNMIGKVPVSSYIHTVAIGRETREFKVRLSSRKWFPFTVVGIGWTGQSFNRTARA